MNKYYQSRENRRIFGSDVNHFYRTFLWSVVGVILSLGSAQAINSMTFTIKGTVIKGPVCVLNGNTAVNVDFGNAVETNRIDGSHYTTPVPFTLSCTGNPSSLLLRFQGTGSAFDSNVLATNVTDLGIKLLQPDNSALNLGDAFTFSYSATPPAIMAVPVKRAGASLHGGTFNATATLLLEVL